MDCCLNCILTRGAHARASSETATVAKRKLGNELIKREREREEAKAKERKFESTTTSVVHLLYRADARRPDWQHNQPSRLPIRANYLATKKGTHSHRAPTEMKQQIQAPRDQANPITHESDSSIPFQISIQNLIQSRIWHRLATALEPDQLISLSGALYSPCRSNFARWSVRFTRKTNKTVERRVGPLLWFKCKLLFRSPTFYRMQCSQNNN